MNTGINLPEVRMNADPLVALLDHIARTRPAPTRPAVTLTWAQSLDGSIATRDRKPLALSGPESLVMTHRLRAAHDGILVGVGAVLADNPRLTVRLAAGPDSQPVVLDTYLRFPPDAALLAHPRPPWLFTGPDPDPRRRATLEAAGARILAGRTDNARVSLPHLLERLRLEGIKRLMVEGGAQVIASFLLARLIDTLVVTVSPHLVGGLCAIGERLGSGNAQLPRLKNPNWTQVGSDFVCWGQIE